MLSLIKTTRQLSVELVAKKRSKPAAKKSAVKWKRPLPITTVKSWRSGSPSCPVGWPWYASERHQEILPLRTRNSDGKAVIVDGNADDHRGADVLVGLTG